MPIRLLPPACVARIAAGEVIDGPAAVVRELVENSLDAQARQITVHLTQGGILGLWVEDDGVGMSAADAALAFVPHATSKVQDLAQLDLPPHLGFRGEALAAIAHAATCVLYTRPASAPLGTQVTTGPNGSVQSHRAGGGVGTRIEVGPLFVHAPARARFLRSPATEAAAVLAVLRGACGAHPQVGFQLIQDDRTTWESPAEPVLDRYRRLLGPMGAQAVQFSAERDGLRVQGALVPPPMVAKAPWILVQGRRVRDTLIRDALARALGARLPAGKSPAIVLDLWATEPGVLDLHVHPAKAEVRFRSPDMVRALIQEALDSVLTAAPLAPLTLPVPARPAPFGPALGMARFSVADAFIVAETPDGLVLIDQHAADERIQFEALQAARAAGRSQVPLDPPEVLPMDGQPLRPVLDTLQALGLTLQVEGHSVSVLSLPPLVPRVAIPALLHELVEVLAHGPDGLERPIEEMVDAACARAACRSAIKAGQAQSLDAQNQLLRRLEATAHGETCPHGRPTALRVGPRELERLFGR